MTPVPFSLPPDFRPDHILLHPGFPATGGDELRRFLWMNRAVLGASHSMILQRALEPAVACCRSFSQGLNPLILSELVDIMDGVLAQADLRPGTDLILSADGLTGHAPGRRGVTDHGAVTVIASFLTGYLTERFPDAELAVVCTTRAADDWQAAVAGDRVDRRDPVDFTALAAVDLEADVTAIAQALDPVAVYALDQDDARAHPLGIGGAFVELVALPDDVRASLRRIDAV